MKERLISVIAEVINNEGGEPGHNLHSWRCEYPDSYGDGPCDCVEQIAVMIVERLELLVKEMKSKEAFEQQPVHEREDYVPFVTIGNGEDPPWIDLPNTCPTCGEENLPLHQSDPPMLQFIKHCGGSWVRGPMLG